MAGRLINIEEMSDGLQSEFAYHIGCDADEIKRSLRALLEGLEERHSSMDIGYELSQIASAGERITNRCYKEVS